MTANPINWKLVFGGVNKQVAQQFASGDISCRKLISSAKTAEAKKELYRLERNNAVRDARRLTRNAISRNFK